MHTHETLPICFGSILFPFRALCQYAWQGNAGRLPVADSRKSCGNPYRLGGGTATSDSAADNDADKICDYSTWKRAGPRCAKICQAWRIAQGRQ